MLAMKSSYSLGLWVIRFGELMDGEEGEVMLAGEKGKT